MMLRNYLIVAVRNLLRHRGYSAINIAGLAVGMTCCILILLAVQRELSIDRFHEKAGRIYKVAQETRSPGAAPSFDWGTPGALGPALRANFPAVEATVRTMPYYALVEAGGKTLGQNLHLVDGNVFDVFTFPFLKGDPRTALRDPSSAVITERTAKRYFGETDPMGKVITVHNRKFPGNYAVTGVLKDIPDVSTIYFDLLIADPHRSPLTRSYWEDWQPTGGIRPVETYVLLPKGYDARTLERALPDFVQRVVGTEFRKRVTYHLQPLTRVALYSGVDFGQGGWFDGIRWVYLLLGIAGFILLVACINFTNLATARSMSRAKEVGMRKVVGAHRHQLIRQFLGESVLLAFLAMLAGVGLAEVLLPAFNGLIEVNLSLDASAYRALLPKLIGVTLVTGLLAGIYPAFFLSAYRPAETLKRALRTGRGARVRRALVVFQFAISAFLIVGTLVMRGQIGFMLRKDLGFDRDHVALLPMFVQNQERVEDQTKRLSNQYEMIRQEFLKHPGIVKASAFRFTPDGGGMTRPTRPEGGRGDIWQVQVSEVEETFFDTFNIPLVAGRTFSPGIPANFTSEFIINETAARQFGWTDPIGKRIEWVGAGSGVVVGVVKDYHFQSLRQRIGPLLFVKRTTLFTWVGLKIRAEGMPETMRFIEVTWKRFVPGQPFECEFLDERIDRWTYYFERRLSWIVGGSSALAIFVACLGLFGLAAFTAEQRTKEIGVRKVLGASVGSIVALLSKDFVKLVLVANLIAWPVAYYVMSRWLQDFAYRIELRVGVFVLGGILALGIALLTVSLQTVKAATANPVEALRYE